MNTPKLLETTALSLLPQFLVISCCTKYSPSHLATKVLQLPNSVANSADLLTKEPGKKQSDEKTVCMLCLAPKAQQFGHRFQRQVSYVMLYERCR